MHKPPPIFHSKPQSEHLRNYFAPHAVVSPNKLLALKSLRETQGETKTLGSNVRQEGKRQGREEVICALMSTLGTTEHWVDTVSEAEFVRHLSAGYIIMGGICGYGFNTSVLHVPLRMGRTRSYSKRPGSADKKGSRHPQAERAPRRYGWRLQHKVQHSFRCLWVIFTLHNSSHLWFSWRFKICSFSQQNTCFLNLNIIAHTVHFSWNIFRSPRPTLLTWWTLNSSFKSQFSCHFLLDAFLASREQLHWPISPLNTLDIFLV